MYIQNVSPRIVEFIVHIIDMKYCVTRHVPIYFLEHYVCCIVQYTRVHFVLSSIIIVEVNLIVFHMGRLFGNI